MEKTKRKGMTAVEILIIVAILVILAVIMIPTVGSVLEEARDVAVLSDAYDAHKAYADKTPEGERADFIYDGGKGGVVVYRNGTAVTEENSNSVQLYDSLEDALEKAFGIVDDAATAEVNEALSRLTAVQDVAHSYTVALPTA